MSRTISQNKNRKYICERKNTRRIFKICEIDPYFYEHYKRKQKNKLMKMKYRLSFTEYRLAVEIDEEKHADKKH